jgi:hypothetical protein
MKRRNLARSKRYKGRIEAVDEVIEVELFARGCKPKRYSDPRHDVDDWYSGTPKVTQRDRVVLTFGQSLTAVVDDQRNM